MRTGAETHQSGLKMPNLKINEAPLLPDLIGIERIPTGGRGDYTTSTDQIKEFVKADVQAIIDTEVSQLEATDAELLSLIEALANGATKAYLTFAALDAAKTTLPANSFANVTNDPSTALNGLYQWDGTTLTKSNYDPLNAAKAYVDASRLFKPVTLTVGTDFNTIIEEGRTVVPTNAIANASSNRPSSIAGVLDVALIGSGVFQVYRVYEFGLSYGRQKISDGTWSPWEQMASVDLIDISAANTLQSAREYADANPLFKPVVIASGQFTNISQIVASGHYVLSFNSVAAEIVGLPEAKAGFIEVLANGTMVTQTYKPSNSDFLYTRTSTAAGVFGAFAKILGQTYTDSAIAASRQNTLDDVFVEGSPNLFNPATVKNGFRLNSSGIVFPVANAKCSDYIPIDGGETYTISATSKPSGVSFFADRDALTSLLYSAATTGTQTITAPAGARFMVVNVKREADASDAVNLKVERGSVATAYTAYSAKSVLRQSTIPENVVTTETALTASIKPYDIVLESKNLFSESGVVLNSYLTNAGGISGSAGWARSGMIPVVAGQTYTLSGSRNRQGLAWFAQSTDLAAISYVSTSGLPLTVTAPVGANFVSFNLQSSTATGWSNIQFELGSVATKYIPFGGVEYRIDGTAIDNVPSPAQLALGTFTGGATSQTIKGVQGADTVLHTVVINQAPSHDLSRVFNWITTSLSGLTLHTCGDDAAPYRLNDTTLGANHGYARTKLTSASHGKTFLDVGSVWVDGASKQWVLVVIDSTGVLSFTSRTDNTGITATSGSLINVSGGR